MALDSIHIQTNTFFQIGLHIRVKKEEEDEEEKDAVQHVADT